MKKNLLQKSQKKSKTLKKIPSKSGITSFDLVRRYICEVKDDLPEGMFNALNGAIRARDVVALRKASLTWDTPQLYSCPRSYYIATQAFALITKVPYPFGGGDQGRRDVALAKFQKSELKCRITTKKLMWYDAHPNREPDLMRVILAKARANVDLVLGSPDRGINEIIRKSRFGPGMTICSLDSARTTPYYKLGAEIRSVTATAKCYAGLAICQSPSWTSQVGKIDITGRSVQLEWNIVKSCRLTFVPKDERSFRTIAIEPYGNVLVQLGVHEYLRGRLKTYAGIDISDQTINQKLAHFGSQNWLSLDTVSTIDLSSASDCVSSGLVHRLVRPQWRGILDDLRTKFYSFEGVEYEMSKWSSMGNGYTFALETLLFWALAQACESVCNSGFRPKVYGDDIVSSKSVSLLTLQVLRYCGFSVNLAKTHVVGPFRESCGSDFYDGVDVRPVFVKNFDLTIPNVYTILNTFDPTAELVSTEWFHSLIKALPPRFRLYSTNDGSVDTCINVSLSWLMRARPSGTRYDQFTQTLYSKRLLFKPRKYLGSDDVTYLTWLYNTRGGSVPIYKLPFFFSANHLEIDEELGQKPRMAITQRKRGIFRLSSKRVHYHSAPTTRCETT